METQKYISGETTITVTPRDKVNNITIELFRGGQRLCERLIGFGETSDVPSAETAKLLSDKGVNPASKREYRSIKLSLPAEVATQIDALSLACKAASVEAMSTYTRKLAAIEGLAELRSAINNHERYANQFQRMMEDENNDGVRPPKPATENLTELNARYPRAAAYLLAEDYSLASHYAKSGAGNAAMTAILDGADHDAAIAEMKQAWSDHCAAHAWD
jgi:hypothetical protein